jgi:hypothetical protein
MSLDGSTGRLSVFGLVFWAAGEEFLGTQAIVWFPAVKLCTYDGGAMCDSGLFEFGEGSMAARGMIVWGGWPAIVMVILSGAVTTAASWGDEEQLVTKVNRAIDRGVQYLRQTHQPTSHWEGFWLNALGDMNGGVTALATLALLNCGVPPEDRDVRAALEYLRSLPNKRTYVVGLTTMVYAEARQPQDLPRIQRNVDWLIANAYREQGKILGWSYPFDKNSSRPDGSNTQYALLGLYAGKTAGAKIPEKVWNEVLELYRNTQVKEGADGGYWYYVEGFRRPSFTMTVAGVSGLLIAGMGLDRSEQRLDPLTGVAERCGQYESQEATTRGLNWIGKHFSFDAALESKSVYYNVYGIERVGRLSGQRFIGRVDWYREGCEWLVREQKENGSWSQARGFQIDSVNVISTSFALLFLSKGRTPILISKLAHGDFAMRNGVLLETAGPKGIIDWNRKRNDARNLTEFASRELFNGLPLGWQVYDPRRRSYEKPQEILEEVGVLVQSPILYLNGHNSPRLSGQQEEIVKKYLEEGGFVLAEACCGAEEFTIGFRDLLRKLFPNNELRPLPADHPIWRAFFVVPPTEFPQLECLELGCRTVVVFSPVALAGYWEEAKYMPRGKGPVKNRGEQAFRLAGNIIAYATGMEPPKQRLTFSRIVDDRLVDRSPPQGFVQPAQLQIPGEPAPAPAAMRNVMAYLRDAARIDVVLKTEAIPPGDPELFKYKFVYMHGRKSFQFSEAEIENLKANLQSGGLLLADACCGKPEFDQAFRALMQAMFPEQKLEPIPLEDELFSGKLGGPVIRTVKRREKAGGDGVDGGFRDLPPALEGIKLNGRWVVIYSKYDLGCALEGHKATDCLGHTRESALNLATVAVLYALKR